MKDKKFFLYTLSIIFALSFSLQCKQKINIKEFIDRELAKDHSNTDVTYSVCEIVAGIQYVPSEQEITATVQVRNTHNVPYTTALTLDDPNQKNCFTDGKAPKIRVTESGQFSFTFQFNKYADAGGSLDNSGAKKGAIVPVTIKLTKKDNGLDFGIKHVTLRCNTPPAELQMSQDGDRIIFTKRSSHTDLFRVIYTLRIANNKEFTGSLYSSGLRDDFEHGYATITVKDIVKLHPSEAKNCRCKRNAKDYIYGYRSSRLKFRQIYQAVYIFLPNRCGTEQLYIYPRRWYANGNTI